VSKIAQYRLFHLLPFMCRLLVRVDHLSSRRLLVDVSFSLYQHLLEIQCAVRNILNEQVMDRGYLGCCTVACARVVECARAYAKVCLLYRVTRHVASTYGRSMTNGANYKRGKLHHSPWHSDIRTSNQLNMGDVGRRTVIRFGTVDPKGPAVAILAMHPRSLDSSWRG